MTQAYYKLLKIKEIILQSDLLIYLLTFSQWTDIFEIKKLHFNDKKFVHIKYSIDENQPLLHNIYMLQTLHAKYVTGVIRV